MNLLYYYKYITIKKPFLFELINITSSVCIHIILFFVFNLIPNVSTDQANWKQVQSTKTKKPGTSWSKGMEVINMVPSADVKIIGDKTASKNTGKKLSKGKIVSKTKGKKSFNQKIHVVKKEEPKEKLVEEKKTPIETKKEVQKPQFIMQSGAKRGVRGITDKTPLSMPIKEKEGDLSKKAGAEKGPNELLSQKAPVKAKPVEVKEQPKIEKQPVVPEQKPVEKKKIVIPQLPASAFEKNAKLPEQMKITKKMAFDRAPEKKPMQPKPVEEKKIPEAEKKNIEEIKPEEKIKEIEQVKQEIKPEQPIPAPEKLVKDVSTDITKKVKDPVPRMSRVGSMEPKKMATSPNKMIASDKIKEISPIPPDMDKKIKNIDVVDKLKEGSPLGTFKNEIKDLAGVGPDISFSPKGDKEIAKAERSTAEKEKIEFDDQKKDFEAPDIEKMRGKIERSITDNAVLKNRLKFEPVMQQEFKRIKIAEAKEEQKPEEAPKLPEEIKNLAKEQSDKIGEKDDLSKLLEELKEEMKKEEQDKKFDTTQKVVEEMAMLEKIEETDKDAKIIGEKNIIASGDKGEAEKTIKIRTTIDRNPTAVTRRTPLTKVSMGGSVSQIFGRTPSPEEMKKIEEYVEKTKKIEEKLGGDASLLFSPIIQKIDLESLLFKEEQGPSAADKGEASGVEELLPEISEKTFDSPVQKESASQFRDKETFTDMGGQMGGMGDFSEKVTKDKGAVKFTFGEKQIGDIKQQFKEISTAIQARKLSMTKQFKASPTIISVIHDATHTLGKGDELIVTLNGDAGETAYFDIGLYRTDVRMNEVSPGLYRGTYRVVEGDNIINAAVVGYLMNVNNVASSGIATNTVTIDTSPGVTIATPPRDSVVDKAVQTITGVLDDPEVKNVVLSLNGNMRNVHVESGYFNADVELVKGKNTIEVMAVNSKGDIGRDKMDITYATYKTGPKVVITFPSDGDVVNAVESPVVEIQGTVSDSNVTKAKMVVNDLTMDISVINGAFSQKVVIFQEINSFVVQAYDQEGVLGISEPITVKASGLGHYEAIVSLTWDSPHADADLILKNATGKFVSHKAPNIQKNPNSIGGGNLELDDKEGYGPEVITLRQAADGLYSIHVNYYEANGDKAINASVSVTLTDTQDPGKNKSKVFGPKLMIAGEEWKVSFIGLPEKGFYSVE